MNQNSKYKTKYLIKSMRLRTLPLSLAGVVCGGVLAMKTHSNNLLVFVLMLLTACLLQVLSNLSNEMGDYRNGVDGEKRNGPMYSLASDGLNEKQLWKAINCTVVACSLSGLAMLLVSYRFCVLNYQFPLMLFLGVAAIWAATHYTLGKKPYGYIGLGDIFVFLFFGLLSVLGSYFVITHSIVFKPFVVLPAIGLGLLSVAVLNVNNIRDMESDKGFRKTVPLRIGKRNALIYQTALVVTGVSCFLWNKQSVVFCCITLPFFLLHIIGVWRLKGKSLDPMLPLLVMSTFFLVLIYCINWYIK